MKTSENTSVSSPLLLLIAAGLLISLLIWLKFVGSTGAPVEVPGITDAGGQQLELPFKDPEGVPEAGEPTPAPLAKKRFDDNRLGTCIIYALVAPSSGEYLIPGCYGKPDAWRYVEEGTVLKVGRHWNTGVGLCINVEALIRAVLVRRYGSDKKLPMVKISFRDKNRIFKNQLDIDILHCQENVTEGTCESIEKQFILNNGGAQKLLLNCCCR